MGGDAVPDLEFEQYVSARSGHLVGFAYLLCRDRHLADGKLPTLRQPFLHGMSGGAKKSRRAIGRKRGVHRRELFANGSFRGAFAGAIEVMRVALPPAVND